MAEVVDVVAQVKRPRKSEPAHSDGNADRADGGAGSKRPRGAKLADGESEPPPTAAAASPPEPESPPVARGEPSAQRSRDPGGGRPGGAAGSASPPDPLLMGILSFDSGLRRHVLRGMWNYENSTAFPAQRFELVRSLLPEENPAVLPSEGEFHGSFGLMYYHITTKGKRKTRSKIIPESGVRITFKEREGAEKKGFDVKGKGTNQFGFFEIAGTASKSAIDGDPTYKVELRKKYLPSTPVVGGDKKEGISTHGAVSSSVSAEGHLVSRELGQQSEEKHWNHLAVCQRAAMEHVERLAQNQHEEAMPGLRARVVGLGFSAEDLNACLDYIRDEAPIVVHLREGTLKSLCSDPWYRSQFETGTSGGTLNRSRRRQWEDAMFGGAYAEAADAEHPKYGVLNITGDILGVRRARGTYGHFFMILAQSVRHRCTFANRDTGQTSGRGKLATNNWHAHVLMEYSDNELLAVLRVSSASRLGGAPSTSFVQYKECQIHGTLSIASDVAVLSVPSREAEASPRLRGLVEAFQGISKCNILWQGDLLEDIFPRGEAKENERHRSIHLHLSLLEHACRCAASGCPSSNCSKMKKLLSHVKTCTLKPSGGCILCKRIGALRQIHARDCRELLCPVPGCVVIREKKRSPEEKCDELVLLSCDAGPV